MEHDELCQWANTPTHRDRAASCPRCALIARVRADERNRWGLGWVAAADSVQALAHAEAVAAKLVEVICDDAESEAWLEDSNQQLQGEITTLIQNGYRLRRERDAARAEVAALRKEVAHAWAVANGEARR